MYNVYIWVACFVVFLPLPGYCVEIKKSDSIFRDELLLFSSDSSLRNASWSFVASDLETGIEIIAINPDLALIPASTQKVITTWVSLSLLGSDYRFKTNLLYDGKITGGHLNGNIIIRGGGDPVFGSTRLHDSLALDSVFSKWLRAIRDSGIDKVKGDIIADGSAFDDHMVPHRWFWGHMGNAFGAGAHALTANENMFTVFLQPGKGIGEPATILRSEPEMKGLIFVNDLLTGEPGSGDGVNIYGAPYNNTRWLTGTVPLGVNYLRVRGSMPDPGYFVASSFYRYLTANGVRITGHATTHRDLRGLPPDTERVKLSDWVSPELWIIALNTNLHSINVYAENIFKTLAMENNGKGTFAKSGELIVQFLEGRGVDTGGMRLHDGSGLSSFNTLTARQLNTVLQHAAKDTLLYDLFVRGLPVAGQSGTLAGMFRGMESQGILNAKSGFLANVLAFAGYTQTKRGNRVAFTLIVNNYAGLPSDMRTRIERLLNAINLSEFGTE